MYAKIALTGLLRRKGRTFFTAFAVATAVSMAILLVSVGVGLKQGSAAMYQNDVDYWIVPKDSTVTDLVSNSEKTMLGDVHQSTGRITADPDIRGATPVLNKLVYASSSGNPKVILGIGVIPMSVDAMPASAQGLSAGDSNSTGQVVVNDRAAELLGLKQGDSLYIGTSGKNLNKSFRVVGVISAAEYSLSPIAVLHLSELQKITGNARGDRANYIIAQGNNALPYLKMLFPDAVVLGSEEYSAYSLVSDKKIFATTLAVSLVSMLIAILFISSTMILSINEKQKEFAAMRAIGISQGSIMKIVFYESIILSMLGGVFGTLLSSAGEKLLNSIAFELFGTGQVAVISPLLALGGAGIALVAGVFSGLIPVIMTRRTDIVGALG